MLLDNVTKDYRVAETKTVHDINIEDKTLTEELKISDRVEAHSESPAFISIKDHKEDFRTNPRCRLINPAKSQIGIISKTILQNLNKNVREATGLEQWQSTKQVLQWFTNIEKKKDRFFLQFDIVDFYPSITEDLLKKALKFTEEQGFPLTKQQKEIVMNARKSLLYARTKPDGEHVPWQKTKNSDFDVTMGAPDGAEVCELVGLFILNQLKIKIPEVNFGLYRDDGLGEHMKMPSKDIDKIRKKLHKIFGEWNLKITVEKEKEKVDFLDVTLRLTEEDFKPYKKPNDKPLYVNTQSNHPPTVIKQIPAGINSRLSAISSKEEHFDNAKEIYQKALNDSGHNYELKYKQPEEAEKQSKAKKRNIMYFNPPFNLGVKTNIGKRFLALVSKHFPKKHILRQLFNRNTVKISYSCTKNLRAIIQTHNQKILAKHKKEEEEKACNCQKSKKDKCLLSGQCVQKNVIYQATTAERRPKKYIGSTEQFKKRYSEHKHSFRHEAYKNSTTLSHHIWEKQLGTEPKLTWEILEHAYPYTKGSRNCGLCLAEKMHIMRQINNPAFLNKRTELAQKCRHKAKFRLSNYK